MPDKLVGDPFRDACLPIVDRCLYGVDVEHDDGYTIRYLPSPAEIMGDLADAAYNVFIDSLIEKWKSSVQSLCTELAGEYGGCDVIAPDGKPCLVCETSRRLRERLLGAEATF